MLKKLIYPVLAALLLTPLIVLCSCDSSVKLTISNETHIDLVVKVVINSEPEGNMNLGRLSPGQSAARQLAESWFGISSISVEATDNAGRAVYHRDYTLIEARKLNGVFKIDEKPSYFSLV